MNQLKDRVCKCGGFIFAPAQTLKELPAFYSLSGVNETVMMHIGFVCIRCGEMISLKAEDPIPDDPTDTKQPTKQKSIIQLIKG